MSVKTARKSRASDELAEAFNKNYIFDFKIKRSFYLNPMHKQFYNCIINDKTKIGFVDGPAGSMKTYIAVYAGLELIKNEDFTKLVYIRSIAESAEKSLGSLPGEGIIEAIPVNFVRGLTFNKTLVIVDEAQNLSRKELTTILTRFGRNSKYIVIGDSNQADVNKSGYKEIFNTFNTEQCRENDIYSFKFGNSEIARSKILRFICSVLGT